jgi:hypothetical protein
VRLCAWKNELVGRAPMFEEQKRRKTEEQK